MPLEMVRRLVEIVAIAVACPRSDYAVVRGPTSPCAHVSGPHAQAEDEQTRIVYQEFGLRSDDLIVCPTACLATLPVLKLASNVGAQSVVLVDKSDCKFVGDLSRRSLQAPEACGSTRSAADRIVCALANATHILSVDQESHEAVARNPILLKRLCRHFETTTIEEFEKHFDLHPPFSSRMRPEGEPLALRCALLNSANDDSATAVRGAVLAKLQCAFSELAPDLPEPVLTSISISADIDSLDELDVVCTRRDWPSAAETLLAGALIAKLVARGTLVACESSGTTPHWLPPGFKLPTLTDVIAGRRTRLFPEDILNPQRRAVYNSLQHRPPTQI